MVGHLGDHLARARILSDLLPLLGEEEECFLVGGTLRDSLIGRVPSDFDFAFPSDPTSVAKRFAARIGGSWFLLDPKRHQSRVVTGGGHDLTYDFAPFRAESLAEDLALRDFTINAMALPLHRAVEGEIFDPLRGREDLQNSCLRMCSPAVLEADPLRVLKGIRHCVDLGLSPELATERKMRRVAPMLARVAPERIRNELASLFHLTPAAPGLRLLELFSIDRQLFGELPAGAEGGRRHVARWEAVQARLTEQHPCAADFFAERIEAGFTRGALMKFASWLYPASDLSVLGGLRLSRHSQVMIRGLQRVAPEDSSLLNSLSPTRRGRALQVEELQGPSPENILFLASLMEPKPSELGRIWQMAEEYFACLHNGRIPSLMNGKTIRDLLGVSDGPALGRALDAVRREEIAGRVQTPEDACNFLKKWQKKKFDKDPVGPYNLRHITRE